MSKYNSRSATRAFNLTKEQLLNLCLEYKNKFKYIIPERIDEDYLILNSEELDSTLIEAHICYMLNEIPKLYELGKIEKAMRWFGFVQGYFWANGKASLKELRSDNR